MLNVSNPKVKQFITEVNKVIADKVNTDTRVGMKAINTNKLLAIISEKVDCGPKLCSIKFQERFGDDVSSHEILRLMRTYGLNVQDEKDQIFKWAKRTANAFIDTVAGKPGACELLKELNSVNPYAQFNTDVTRYVDKERVLISVLLEESEELAEAINRDRLYTVSASVLKYIYIEMYNIAIRLHNNKKEEPLIVVTDKKRKDGPSYRELKEQVEELEGALERTNAMLKDLQDEFDESLQETKILELTDFFAKLNSEKYGCILDELMIANKGMAELKRQKYEIPIEINGIMIMTKKLIQFIRDNHIEPMMKINDLKAVTASDVEFCIYEGTPFMSADEEKLVRVVSPGWVYKDKDIQISRPKVKEADE